MLIEQDSVKKCLHFQPLFAIVISIAPHILLDNHSGPEDILVGSVNRMRVGYRGSLNHMFSVSDSQSERETLDSKTRTSTRELPLFNYLFDLGNICEPTIHPSIHSSIDNK